MHGVTAGDPPMAKAGTTGATGATKRARSRWAMADRGLVVLIALYLLSLPFVAHRMTASDAIEYYVYDRSLYFDHDLNFFNDYQGFYDRNPTGLAKFKAGFLDKTNPHGRAINNGPCGSALLWSPFFLVGDGIARALHAMGSTVAADGYSQPYLWAVSLGSAIYAGIALILTYLLARAITNATAAFWASLIIWLGTPALFYSDLAPTYAHATSWFAVAVFLTVWYRTRDRRSWRGWLALGALGGLVAMVREQDAVFLLVPVVDAALRLLPGLRHPDRAWRRDLAGTVGGGILMGLTSIVAFAPQLAIYKTLNGNFRPSSEVSDKLHWYAPNALRVLFDPGHGLFIWTPVLLVAVVGLIFLTARDPRLGLSLLTGFVFTWYLNGAFQTWTTAGSFGARRFIVCSPLFAVGLAEVFRRWGTRTVVSSQKPVARNQKPEARGQKPVASSQILSTQHSCRPEGTRSTQHSLCVWVPVLALIAILWNGGLIIQFVEQLMDRQQLEWPLVLVNQFTTVPAHLFNDLWRFVTDPGSFYQGGKS